MLFWLLFDWNSYVDGLYLCLCDDMCVMLNWNVDSYSANYWKKIKLNYFYCNCEKLLIRSAKIFSLNSISQKPLFDATNLSLIIYYINIDIIGCTSIYSGILSCLLFSFATSDHNCCVCDQSRVIIESSFAIMFM